MSIYRKPIIFTLVATIVVLAGSVVSTFIPLFNPSMTPKTDVVTPYTALQVEGRDIYIREGCNNCHTQTVRPLLAETARYGEPSKLGEFAYDRPHLWGSKRTGPDLARVGGKYPDSWHVQHMKDPQSMFAESNMPAYPWLADRKLRTDNTARKMKVLGFPFTDGQKSDLEGKTELDALIAYLQKLGRDVKEASAAAQAAKTVVAEAAVQANPFSGDETAAKEGEELYNTNCAVCHGKKLEGGIGPNLTDDEWIYGGSDGEVYKSIAMGRPGGMPPWEASLGSEGVWRLVSFIRQSGGGE